MRLIPMVKAGTGVTMYVNPAHIASLVGAPDDDGRKKTVVFWADGSRTEFDGDPRKHAAEIEGHGGWSMLRD